MRLYSQVSRALFHFGMSSIFLLLSVQVSFAQTTDLDQDGIVDSEDPEVVVSTNQFLPAGEYVFQNLTIDNSAVLTLGGNPSSPDNFKGVKITATNLTISSGASISADGSGYPSGQGPGAAPTNIYYGNGGGGYGGQGGGWCDWNGCRAVGATYGSAVVPTDLGSDGGGGAIWLNVVDTFTDNGAVSANGSYKGSGGSIYVTVENLTGSGNFMANGGDMGGGGRIALHYKNSLFAGTTTADGGCAQGWSYVCGGAGTIGFIDLTTNDLYINKSWVFEKVDNEYSYNNILMSDHANVRVGNEAHVSASVLTVESMSNFSFLGKGILTIPTIHVTDQGTVSLPAGEYEFDTLTLSGGSTLALGGDPKSTNDFKGVKITATNLTISPDSSINTDGMGYPQGQGPGAAPANIYYGNGGGGYGGSGGGLCDWNGCRAVGSTYGSSTEPIDLGSDGGGGAIRLVVAGTLTNDGTISANGLYQGSGGSIYVTVENLTGSGNFMANGGVMGGGGRIAIYYEQSTFTGASTADGGCAQGWSYVCGSEGTVVFEQQNTLPQTDFCPNIDGIQTEVPEGMEVVGGQCVEIAQPVTLENPTETEDDGVQDAKGVADKTNFTFSVTTQGDPDNVSLIVDGTPEDMSQNGDVWSITKTFPKGTYQWHFEAVKGALTATTETQQITTGYSNVAFLPGLEASRLYRQQTFENQLWEPNRNKDVEKLYLDPDTGKSTYSGIYTRDVIDQANILPSATGAKQPNIYLSFINFMNDEMVGKGIINEWEALPYDWRFDYSQLLTNGKKVGGTDAEPNLSYEEATSTPYILQELRRLAETSDTGKVTIITHSNGGLVAKYLFDKLQKENDTLLPKVDTVIMVAAPQVGTPDAVEALLHGDGQQLGLWDMGFIMDEDRSRTLGENMPSAYDLLPTQKYFDTVHNPVITFSGSHYCSLSGILSWGIECYIPELKDRAGTSISSYTDMRTFLLGDNGKRPKPAHDDEESPNVLNSRLFPIAEATHSAIDAWTPPESMQVIQIAGWGEKTLRTIEYSCGWGTCSSLDTLDRDIKQTVDGDGTVVVPSAVYMSTTNPNVERYYVDLPAYNTWYRIDRTHKDILEVNKLLEFVGNVVQGSRNHDDAIIKKSKPPVTDAGDRLDFTLHSPVAVHLYTEDGLHTGPIANPNPDSDFLAFETQLPNSYYHEYGEVKYIGSDTNEPITVVLEGEDLGTFTFNVEQTHGDDVIASTAWKNIPVTASTKATLNIQTVQTISELQLDVDEDNVVDFSLTPSEEAQPEVSLEVFEKTVQTLGLEKGVTQSIVAKISAARKSLEKGNSEAATGQLNALLNYLQAQKGKKISVQVVETLSSMIGRIQNDIVK